MNFSIQIEGEALKLMIDGRRIKGSLGFSADGQLNFNPWRHTPPEPYEYVRLRHGRACVSKKRIRLYIDMERDEKVDHVSSLYSDTYDAISFIRKEISENDNRQQQAG